MISCDHFVSLHLSKVMDLGLMRDINFSYFTLLDKWFTKRIFHLTWFSTYMCYQIIASAYALSNKSINITYQVKNVLRCGHQDHQPSSFFYDQAKKEKILCIRFKPAQRWLETLQTLNQLLCENWHYCRGKFWHCSQK